MSVSLSPILSALLAAFANVLGALAITGRRRWSPRTLDVMIAFSSGFLISVAILEMIPEAIERNGSSAAWVVLLGFFLVHFTQHTLAPHFHFGEETHQVTQAVGVSALIGLMLHMFVDGVAIASGFTIGKEVGILILLAIILHKLPEGSAISSLFLAAGFSRAKALAAAAALGIATILGALLTETVPLLSTYGLSLAAGVTVYVAASNLLPEFQHKRNWFIQSAFFAGGLMYFIAHRVLHNI